MNTGSRSLVHEMDSWGNTICSELEKDFANIKELILFSKNPSNEEQPFSVSDSSLPFSPSASNQNGFSVSSCFDCEETIQEVIQKTIGFLGVSDLDNSAEAIAHLEVLCEKSKQPHFKMVLNYLKGIFFLKSEQGDEAKKCCLSVIKIASGLKNEKVETFLLYKVHLLLFQVYSFQREETKAALVTKHIVKLGESIAKRPGASQMLLRELNLYRYILLKASQINKLNAEQKMTVFKETLQDFLRIKTANEKDFHL